MIKRCLVYGKWKLLLILFKLFINFCKYFTFSNVCGVIDILSEKVLFFSDNMCAFYELPCIFLHYLVYFTCFHDLINFLHTAVLNYTRPL